ncbi:MAG TPA: DUF2007 domain-containing protein [Pirellulaceae bacterium]|nr:DUF2007 domain-containing protein [Pirellulaceae bacterium]
MSSQPIVIYSAANVQQAHLLKGLLQQQGIAAWIVNDAIQIAGGDLPLGWAAAPRLVVAEQDALRARQLAEEFDRKTTHEPTDDDSIEPEPLVDWADWPVCPACRDRRSARCPVCGVSGTNFPLADIQDTTGGEQVLLKCEDCDDLIRPEWYRLCARCGHDYGDGIEVSHSGRTSLALDRRLAIVLAMLLTGALSTALYFVWLFRWSSN